MSAERKPNQTSITVRGIVDWITGSFGEANLKRSYPTDQGRNSFLQELNSLAMDFPTITLAELRTKAESEPSYGDFPPTAGKLRFWCKTLRKEAENRSEVSSSAARATDSRSAQDIKLDAESHARYVLAIDLEEKKERFHALRNHYMGLLTADSQRLGYKPEHFLSEQTPGSKDQLWVNNYVQYFNQETPASTKDYLKRLRNSLAPGF